MSLFSYRLINCYLQCEMIFCQTGLYNFKMHKFKTYINKKHLLCRFFIAIRFFSVTPLNDKFEGVFYVPHIKYRILLISRYI